MTKFRFKVSRSAVSVSPLVSVIPVAALLCSLVLLIVFAGADSINTYSPIILLSASALAFVLAGFCSGVNGRSMIVGARRSAAQVLPAVPMLVCIAALSTTWMLSGVVPVLVDYGLMFLNPRYFLVTACVSCAVVSVLTGSSWSTIATIGVSFMGIGSLMGYDAGWIAGAVISGAYFGDKISPLSDTTVVASSTCGIDLFEHIRYLMYTTVPAIGIALLVFAFKGISMPADFGSDAPLYIDELHDLYNISPTVLVIPAITVILIALRVNTLITLAAGAILGAVGVFVFQPDMAMSIIDVISATWAGNVTATGNSTLDELLSTGGILGMMPTIYLVLSAMVFGSVMIGTGFLGSLAKCLTRFLHSRRSIVPATVATGLAANACTADQYLSLIITGNVFRGVYRRCRLEMRLLSRSMEDSVSVTSVLIPWNSCGVTQSTVLGVSTLVYFPYCIFNYLSPIMSIAIAWTGFKIRSAVRGSLARA